MLNVKNIFSLLCFMFFLISQNSFSQNKDLDGWSITTNNSENYVGITLANGRIGVLPSKEPFKIKSIILNNVFEKESKFGVSKIVEAPNFMNMEIFVDGELITFENISEWSQSLNMKEASFYTTFNYKNKLDITYTYYALRNLPYVVMSDVSIETIKEVDLIVKGGISTSNEFKDELQSFRELKDLETYMPILQTNSKTKFEKHTVTATTTFIFEDKKQKLEHFINSEKHHGILFEKALKRNEVFNFKLIGSVCSSQDFKDPQNESERFVIYTMLNKSEVLLKKHKEEWSELWESDIIIEGDLQSQLDVRLAMYHLYSFARKDSNLSIAPMGLSSRGYNGHIFWDSELWMFPPLLVLNQEIAKSTLNYRFNKLEQAKNRAINYGFKGAMFPWESDETGEEATPTWALTGTFEHHITADVGIAFWNYYRITKDLDWLRNKGYPILKEVADFWVSRSEKNNDGSYSIKNVVGANEFAHNVNDNAFTNGSAKTVLKYAVEAANELNLPAKDQWENVSNKLKIHKFVNGITKEHEDYSGEIIKQVDVNLLSYPLNLITDSNIIKKDIKYYELKIAKEGPAMSHSVLAVLYARLGNSEKAFELFKKAYEPNKRAPFGALSESATSNNPYFATGAGGMLQTVLFGFGGLHITNNGLIQENPTLPTQWKSLIIKGVGKNKKTFFVQ